MRLGILEIMIHKDRFVVSHDSPSPSFFSVFGDGGNTVKGGESSDHDELTSRGTRHEGLNNTSTSKIMLTAQRIDLGHSSHHTANPGEIRKSSCIYSSGLSVRTLIFMDTFPSSI